MPSVLGQLGTLALRQNDLNEARRRYLEALDDLPRNERTANAKPWRGTNWAWSHKKREIGPRPNGATRRAWHFEERLGHAAGAAQTCNQLAIVAEGAGRLDEAERWYLRAIEASKKRRKLAMKHCIQQSRQPLPRAEPAGRGGAYARRAREINETLDLSSNRGKTYNILAQIAEKRGRVEEAREWRRKADETYAAYVDRVGWAG